MAAALHRALDDEALAVVYQPLVRSGDGQTLGVEALLRWDVPGRGADSPGRLHPGRGAIRPDAAASARWVLRTACAQLASWHQVGLGRDLLVHVNLSGPELLDAGPARRRSGERSPRPGSSRGSSASR